MCPDLEGLRARLRPHLHPRHGIRLEVVVPRRVVRRSRLGGNDDVPLPVAVVHHWRGALLPAARPRGGEQDQPVPELPDSLPALGVELLDDRFAPPHHPYLLLGPPPPARGSDYNASAGIIYSSPSSHVRVRIC